MTRPWYRKGSHRRRLIACTKSTRGFPDATPTPRRNRLDSRPKIIFCDPRPAVVLVVLASWRIWGDHTGRLCTSVSLLCAVGFSISIHINQPPGNEPGHNEWSQEVDISWPGRPFFCLEAGQSSTKKLTSELLCTGFYNSHRNSIQLFPKQLPPGQAKRSRGKSRIKRVGDIGDPITGNTNSRTHFPQN